jgi:HPt (histidine-containing phosphotransfer) domain-containing protein
MGGDEALFQSIVRFFDEDSPGLLQQIRAGIRAGDAEQVMRAAHSLKGLAANFNAETTVAVAMQMQEIGQSGSIQAALALDTLSELEREVSRLNEALAPYRSN